MSVIGDLVVAAEVVAEVVDVAGPAEGLKVSEGDKGIVETEEKEAVEADEDEDGEVDGKDGGEVEMETAVEGGAVVQEMDVDPSGEGSGWASE